MDDDEEFAALATTLHDDHGEPKVPLAGYSEVAVRLDNVFDAINAVNETLLAVYSTKKNALHRPNRAPRPQTASQRLKARQKRERIDSIVQHMTGGR